jgi:hypothetical protein
MGIIQSETNRGKKSVIFDDHIYRLSNVLKNGDKSYRCTQNNATPESEQMRTATLL